MRLILIISILTLTSCAGFKDREIKFGKACFNKLDGSVSWSYVWIKDKNIKLDKCQN